MAAPPSPLVSHFGCGVGRAAWGMGTGSPFSGVILRAVHIRCWLTSTVVALMYRAARRRRRARRSKHTKFKCVRSEFTYRENYGENMNGRTDTPNGSESDHRRRCDGGLEQRAGVQTTSLCRVRSCWLKPTTIILLNNIIFPNICALT